MSAGIIKNSKILLDKPAEFCYYNQAPRERRLAGQTEQHFHGGIAQLGERLNGIQEVSGSIPLISTKERGFGTFRSLFFVSTAPRVGRL